MSLSPSPDGVHGRPPRPRSAAQRRAHGRKRRQKALDVSAHPPAPSFTHIQETAARRPKEAIQELEFFIAKFPEYEEIARAAIRTIKREARRTPKSDRDRVLAVFENAQCPLMLPEVASDSGLPVRDVKLILKEFVAEGILEQRSQGGSRNAGRSGTNWLYCFAHLTAFSPVFSSQNI